MFILSYQNEKNVKEYKAIHHHLINNSMLWHVSRFDRTFKCLLHLLHLCLSWTYLVHGNHHLLLSWRSVSVCPLHPLLLVNFGFSPTAGLLNNINLLGTKSSIHNFYIPIKLCSFYCSFIHHLGL